MSKEIQSWITFKTKLINLLDILDLAEHERNSVLNLVDEQINNLRPNFTQETLI